jgi:ATP-dependent Lon protease
VIIPEENVKDLSEISAEIKNKIDIIPGARVDDVLKAALVRPPERISWDEASETPAVAGEDDKSSPRVTAH